MTGIRKKQAGIVLALTLIAIIVSASTFFKISQDWWNSNAIRLDQDLEGGSYFLLTVQTEEAVKSQLTAIARSVSEELNHEQVNIIQARPIGNRELEITLLGAYGLAPLEAHIRENYRLLTRTNTERSGRRITITVTYAMQEAWAAEIERDAIVQAVETIRSRVDQYGVAGPTIRQMGENRVMVHLPDITNLDTLKAAIGSIAKLEFRLVADESQPQEETVSMRTREGEHLRVEKEVLLTGDVVEQANVEINPQTEEIEVALRLNPSGRQTFGRITSDNVGRQLAIILDGVVQSYSVINKPILDGTAQISGGLTRVEAHHLDILLRSGALPAPLTFKGERTVSGNRGSDSNGKVVTPLLLSSLAVVIFAIFYYRRAGVYVNPFAKLGGYSDRTFLWIGVGIMAVFGMLLLIWAWYFVRGYSAIVSTDGALPFSLTQVALSILSLIAVLLISSIVALHISSRLLSIPSRSWSRATFLIGLAYTGLIVLNLAVPDRLSAQFVFLLLFTWLAVWLSILKATYELSYSRLAAVFVLFVAVSTAFQAAIGFSMFAFVYPALYG